MKDSAGSNMFIYKYDYDPEDPQSTPLKMGPAWDYDASFGLDGFSNIHYATWFWYSYLLEIPEFYKVYQEKWAELSPDFVFQISLYLYEMKYSDLAEAMDLSRQLEAVRWDEEYLSVEDELEKYVKLFRQHKTFLDGEILK